MKLTELIWQGREMIRDNDGHIVWVESSTPMGGEAVSMGTLGMQYVGPGEVATHYEFPVTVWGDYCGDSVGRSNYRSLLRDYPEIFVEVRGGYNSQYLAIPVESLTDELREIATNLLEQYPLYDEEDHSALEMETLEEDWDGWILSDIRSELSWDHGCDTDNVADDTLRDMFYEWLSDTGEYPYMETAVSVNVPHLSDFISLLATRLGEER